MRLWVAEYAKNKARKQGHFVLIPISRREKVPHWPTFHKQRRTNYIVPKMSNNICYQAKYTTSTNHPNPKVYDVKLHCRLHCQSYGLNLARKAWSYVIKTVRKRRVLGVLWMLYVGNLAFNEKCCLWKIIFGPFCNHTRTTLPSFLYAFLHMCSKLWST